MQENIPEENIPEENIPEENIINQNIFILDNKITYYDLLYKKWCRKIDLIIKSIGYKYEEHEKKINSLDNILYSKIESVDKILSKLDKKNKKYDKIIVLLINKINKNNSILIVIKRWVSIFMLIFILFFIIILYIIWGIYLEHYIN